MLDHISLDRKVFSKWLKAGFIDNGSLYPIKAGVPQGSPISPAITNMVLDGLEELLKQNFKVKRVKGVRTNPKVQMVRFADDFVRHEARFMHGVKTPATHRRVVNLSS